MIERARQKLAWESALPKVTDRKSEMRRKSLTAMIEMNDTSFREAEIEALHQLRIDLSKDKLAKSKRESDKRLEGRLERLLSAKRQENHEKVEYWKHQLLRSEHAHILILWTFFERSSSMLVFIPAMRKLNLSRKKINKKYYKWDVVTLHKDKTSELYAPQLRFGENPSRRNEIIDIQCRYLKRFRGRWGYFLKFHFVVTMTHYKLFTRI